MPLPYVTHEFVLDIFNRIKENSTLKDFFRAILSAPGHSHIRSVRDELAEVIPEVINPLKYEASMVDWIFRAAISVSNDEDAQPILACHGPSLLAMLQDKKWAREWAHSFTTEELRKEMVKLVDKKSGLHANATHIQKDAVQKFSISDLTQGLKEKAPMLWSTITVLGDAMEHKAEARKKRKSVKAKAKKNAIQPKLKRTAGKSDAGDSGSSSSSSNPALSDEYNSQDDNDDAPLELTPSRLSLGKKRRRVQDPPHLFKTLRNIKTVAILSILAHSSNQQANMFQAALGMHLKANHATEKLIHNLHHMGVIVSDSTIQAMTASLNENTAQDIKKLCATNTATVIYDNINFAQYRPEATLVSNTTFVNMTAATFVPLRDTTPEQLKLTQELWDNNPLNPDQNQSSTWVNPTFKRLYCTPLPDGRSVSDAVRDDLVFQIARILLETTEGGEKLVNELRDSFVPVHQVPMEKVEPLPAEVMDFDESSLHGNISVIEDLRKQGGYTSDQDDYLMLVHCDLATYKSIKGIQAHC